MISFSTVYLGLNPVQCHIISLGGLLHYYARTTLASQSGCVQRRSTAYLVRGSYVTPSLRSFPMFMLEGTGRCLFGNLHYKRQASVWHATTGWLVTGTRSTPTRAQRVLGESQQLTAPVSVLLSIWIHEGAFTNLW